MKNEVLIRLFEGGSIRVGYLPRDTDLDAAFPDRFPAVVTERMTASLVTLPNEYIGLILDARSFFGWVRQKRELVYLRFDGSARSQTALELILAALLMQSNREQQQEMWERIARRRRRSHWEPEPIIPLPPPHRPRPPHHPRPPKKSEPIYGIQPVPPAIRVPNPPRQDD